MMDKPLDQADRIVTASFSLSIRDLMFLEEVGNKRHDGNRSEAFRHYYKLGRKAEEMGWKPEKSQ